MTSSFRSQRPFFPQSSGEKSNLDEKFNFLIGQNGTGKTTVINLIAAALIGDLDKLERVDFRRIYLVLKESGTRKNPSIEVIKSEGAGLPFSKINYYYFSA